MKRLVAVFLLLGGLLVAGGASATTIIDSSALTYGSAGTTTMGNARKAYVFTVGASALNLGNIQFIPVGAPSSGTNNQDITISIYQWDTTSSPDGPVGSAIASQTFTSIPFVQINTASLSDLTTVAFTAPIQLSPNTSYGLVFGPSSINSGVVSTGLGLVSSGNPTCSGVTCVGVRRSSDAGSTWSTVGVVFYLNVSTTEISAVPTLSEWSQMLLALMVLLVGWHSHRQRLN